MRIIDEKGKLFGKLNIIDLIAIILIVAVAGLLGFKLMSNSGGFAGEGQSVIYTVKVQGVDAKVYESIQGMLPSQLMASNEMLEGQVTSVEAIPIEEDTYGLKKRPGVMDDYTITRSSAGSYDLIFTIEATVKNNISSELGTQEIRVGKSHIVKTTTFELENGIILTCERPEAAGE